MIVLYYLSEQYITMQYRYYRLLGLILYFLWAVSVSCKPLMDDFPKAVRPGHSWGSLANWPPLHTIPPTRTALPGWPPVTGVVSAHYSVSLYVTPGSLPCSFCPWGVNVRVISPVTTPKFSAIFARLKGWF